MPHSRRLTPEAADDDRDGESARNLPGTSQNNGEPSPPTASNRRDENSISFRHFLQPHSDVVPTRHRNSRGASGGSIDLVDGVSMALPDFVQDHLIVESIISASASGGSGSSDVQDAAGVQNLHHPAAAGIELVAGAAFPEYSPSQCSQSYLSKRNRRQQESNASNGDGPVGCSSQGPVALPDFLSDGPMLFSGNSLTDGGILPSSTSSNRAGGSARLGATNSGSSLHSLRPSSSRESESLPQQVDRLRRELAEKNRRLSQLESDLTRQKNETSMFEAAYLNSEQTLQATTRRALAAEARIAELNHELQFFKNQLTDRLTLKRGENSGGSSLASENCETSSVTRNGRSNSNVDSNRIIEIAYSAEYLVGELMGQLNALKSLAIDSPKRDEDHAVISSKHKSKSKDGPHTSKQ